MTRDDHAGSFTDRFARVLFDRYPEWGQYSVLPSLEWQKAGDLAVEVPSRLGPKLPLRVETMDDGIIVSWGSWHVHCDPWGDTYAEDEFVAKAMELIEGILSESIVILDYWKDGREVGGGSCAGDEIDETLANGLFSDRGYETTVRSWNGTYDRGENRLEQLAGIATVALFRMTDLLIRIGARTDALSQGCSAVAVSGGMPAFENLAKNQRWLQDGAEVTQGIGIAPKQPKLADYPFFAGSHPWVLTTLAWSILGADPRVYAVFLFDADRTALLSMGLAMDIPETIPSAATARIVPFGEGLPMDLLNKSFFDPPGNSIALGFCDDRTELESHISSAPELVEASAIGLPGDRETIVRELPPSVHPEVFDGVLLHGIGWLLDLVPLVILPYGPWSWDALFITNRMSQDEMVKRMRAGIGDKGRVIVAGGDDAYEAWVRTGRITAHQ